LEDANLDALLELMMAGWMRQAVGHRLGTVR
jgi:hypothetical protein